MTQVIVQFQRLEDADPLLLGAYQDRENPIEKCALAARKRGFRMFALQNGGWCAASVGNISFDVCAFYGSICNYVV